MRTRRRLTAIIYGLIALTLLIALLAAVPYLLIRVGTLPDHLPQWQEISDALVSPDDGRLFLGALTLIGWYGWVTFSVSVALEAMAALRDRKAPRFRMLGGSQQLAGTLIGGILLLLPAGTAFATPPASAATLSAPVLAGAVATAPTTASSTTTTETYTGPIHQVQRGESLWSIAEKRLGSGTRWHDIVDANKGISQADGSHLTADTTILQPGWTLRLPADAQIPDGDDRPQSRLQDSPHTVQPGETLSSIAQDRLGNANDYPEITALNAGVRQPDGRTLTDPDKIYPGWQLQIPAAHEGADAPTPPGEQEPSQDDDRGGEDSGDTEHQQPGPTEDAHDTAQPTERPGEPAAQDPPAEGSGEPDAGSSEANVRTVAAAGTILAAAVLAVVATRRSWQQRHRRAKRRIPMPDGAVADFEKQLRVVSAATGTELADRALRTMAANCRRVGRPLPEVEAMRITALGVELHLAAATPSIEPFTERDSPTVWWCPAHTGDLLDEDSASDVTPPYPALVSVGATLEGDPVLVDLETIGLLRLDGSPSEVREVMRALAVEMASSRLAPPSQIVLAGAGSDLQAVYADQVAHHTDLSGAIAELQSHDAFQREALTNGGHDHLRGARLSDETSGDSWIPRVLLATGTPSGPSAAQLEELLTARPRTSVAVVTAAGSDLDLPGAWTFPAQPDSTVELPGLDLTVQLQRLDDAAYDRLIQLLVTSSRTDDVPAPPWTTRTEPADGNARSGVIATDVEHSALAPETIHDPVTMDEPLGVAPAGAAGSGLPSAAPPSMPISPDIEGLSDAAAGPEAFAGAAVEELLQGGHGVPALDSGVWDGPASDDEFASALNEVLAEQEHSSPPPPGTADENQSPSGPPLTVLGDPDPEPSRAARAERRIMPRPSGMTATVLAALSTPPDPPAAPQIQVLGPVDLVGTLGNVGSNRRNSLIEVAAWLVLHPGLSRHDLDSAIWPGMRITADTRNTTISRLRAWMGYDPLLPHDDPRAAYLPPIQGGVYRFSDEVTSDWHQFQALYQQGMHSDGQDADIALSQALALVRGRPFADVDPSRYTWAEADIQEMISAIVDVAHELAERRRGLRDYRAAAQAVTKGLLADSQSELLYRDLFTICHETGDRDGLERAAHQLARINTEEDCDSSPETVSLLRALLHGEPAHPILGSAAS
ncbi:LysM peptidoglycan-binding domain-containing protein [Streptomyces xiamenensis]|uniref:LysM peptidoglycan-binding domain-containing protein n=1 Tax=Streptomyces xiamenensis TaxID=408015 RepID=UPI0036EA49E5